MQGVTFGNKHSYRTWGLLLKSRPFISPPKPKIMMIPVPGTDVIIDLTEALTDGVKYEPRTITCEFWVVNARYKWADVYSSILNELHGKKVQITMDDDPNYYYLGRVTVDEWQSDKATSTIVLTAEVEPYKHARYGEGRLL